MESQRLNQPLDVAILELVCPDGWSQAVEAGLSRLMLRDAFVPVSALGT